MTQPMTEKQRQDVRKAAGELIDRATNPVEHHRAVRQAISLINSTMPVPDHNGYPIPDDKEAA